MDNYLQGLLKHDLTLRVYWKPSSIKDRTSANGLVKENAVDKMVQLVKKTIAGDKKRKDTVNTLSGPYATKIYQSCANISTEIRTSGGCNALHLAIKQEEEEFMKMLFYANK